MLESNILETLIALVFIYLLLSLAVSTLVEAFAQIRSLRAKKLQKVIESMLKAASKNTDKSITKETFGEQFYKHPLINNFGKLSKKWSHTQVPSYLTANNFSTVLLDLLIKNQNNKNNTSTAQKDIHALLDNISDSDFKETLTTFLGTTKNDWDTFKKEIENWYDNTMERFTGYYKRHTQLWLFIFGFVFCVFFNADTISIVSKLTNNPASRLAIVEQATQYIHDHQANFSADSLAHGKKIQQDTLKNRDDGQQFLAEVDSLRKSIISTDLKQAQTTLGLGWSTEELDTLDFPGWVLKIIGI